MEHPSKRRRIERNLGGPVEGLNLNNGRERSVSLGGSSKNEKPIMPKLVLPPHGAPGHPAHGEQTIDALSQGVDRPHYPLESADGKPARVHARQIVQPAASDVVPSGGTGNVSEPTEPTAPKTNEASPTPTSYPGQVVPPAAVAAANARNQALESQQSQTQSVAVKQLDAVPQAPAPASATHAAASASPNVIQVPESSSQQIVKAPSTPPPSNSSPTSGSSASYFSASLASSPSSSPQHISSPPVPSPTSTPSKHEFSTNLNGTMSGKLLLGSSDILVLIKIPSFYFNILHFE